MSIEIQTELWVVPFNEEQRMWHEMFILKEKQDNLRRGLLRSFSDMKKEVALLRDEVACLNEHKQGKPVILTV